MLNRVYRYMSTYGRAHLGEETNGYVKFVYHTNRRNVMLWAVPSMYAIARGRREFISEEYSRVNVNGPGDYDVKPLAHYSSIPHQRKLMVPLYELAAPAVYNVTMYGDNVLSPFNKANKVFYNYTTEELPYGQVRLCFQPKHGGHTQLVRGSATVDYYTGRIVSVVFDGEFDMVSFHTEASGKQGPYDESLLPRESHTTAVFTFMGNRISADVEAMFGFPVSVTDSTEKHSNIQFIDSVRPITLTPKELDIYAAATAPAEELDSTSSPQRHKRDFDWDVIGESLVRSIRAESENASLKLSPIINPQYLGYSRRKGFSYRFKLGARYTMSESTDLNFNARFGYNFKQRRFYYSLPLRLNYSFRQRQAYAELLWTNGNRIGAQTVVDEAQRRLGTTDDPNISKYGEFDDQSVSFTNHLPFSNRFSIEGGVVYHRRKAVNGDKLHQLGMPTEYHSLAPRISVQARPWRYWPVFTVDYERGLSLHGTDLVYERIEADASLKHRMRRLQTLNIRLGGGFYTLRDNKYFMDFSNFRDENLPEGWDDDWAGNFQLLSSHMYNSSKYYVRGNVSYESPLLAASYIPLVGRFVERERVYLSTLGIAHTRLYSELGYGFTCRLFSLGAFASFLNTSFQEAGCKFTFELFRRW